MASPKPDSTSLLLATRSLAGTTRSPGTFEKPVSQILSGKRLNLNSGKRLAGWLFLGTLLMIPGLPGAARASSGTYFLETIGISTAVGTVLGASTLPFYDQPGDHTANLAYGASAGAIVGVGVCLYGLITGPSQDEFAADRARKQRLAEFDDPAGLKHSTSLDSQRTPAHPALVKMPLVSLRF